MKHVAPAAIGIYRGRWRNVRSLVRAALALMVATSPGRPRNQLSPEWLELWKPLARSDRIALSRVVHFFSAAEIGPQAVTEESFDEFRRHLDASFLQAPAETFALTARTWRKAQKAVEGWPRVSVLVPDRRRNWIFGWDRFPASFHKDCHTWLDRLAGRDLLNDAPCRPVRPTTVAHRAWQIRGFATAVVLKGRDAATLTTLRDLVEIETLKSGLRFFLDRTGKPTSAIADLATTLKAIARHHVGAEPALLEQMASIIRRLGSDRRGLSETNRARLRPFDETRNVDALLQLPAELMRQAAARHRSPQRAAVRAQLAVAIEILLMTALRKHNLATLDIERNLVRLGRGDALCIVIGADDVKNGEPLEFSLPPESAALVERYIRDFRPALTSGANTALFPGKGGGPKHPTFLGEQISGIIWSHMGLKVHPHLFRHIAAKLFLDSNPGAYEIVRRVLAHRSIDTTTNYYTGLEGPAAVRYFDKAILQLRWASKVKADINPKKTAGRRR